MPGGYSMRCCRRCGWRRSRADRRRLTPVAAGCAKGVKAGPLLGCTAASCPRRVPGCGVCRVAAPGSRTPWVVEPLSISADGAGEASRSVLTNPAAVTAQPTACGVRGANGDGVAPHTGGFVILGRAESRLVLLVSVPVSGREGRRHPRGISLPVIPSIAPIYPPLLLWFERRVGAWG